MDRTTVLAFCGSLRARSLNLALLQLAERMAPDLRFVGGAVVPHLPLYNADLEHDPPASVREFRVLAGAARAVVIASPEYLHAPSGVTTNALAWLAGLGLLFDKPVLLLSASPGTTGGLAGLVGLYPTIQQLGAVPLDPVTISRAESRLDADGAVLDPAVYLRLELALDEVRAAVEAPNSSRATWSLAR